MVIALDESVSKAIANILRWFGEADLSILINAFDGF